MLLDPRYKMVLEYQISHAKKECLKCLNGSDSSGEDRVKDIVSSPIASASDSDSMEPQCKRLKKATGLSYIYRMLKKKATVKKEVAQRHLRYSTYKALMGSCMMKKQIPFYSGHSPSPPI